MKRTTLRPISVGLGHGLVSRELVQVSAGSFGCRRWADGISGLCS